MTDKMPTLVLLWVWFCAYLNCAGWALSAIHQLNAAGYAVTLAIWLAALLFWKSWEGRRVGDQKIKDGGTPSLPKIYRRFRKPFPMAFLILAAMAFLGGVIYPPSNYDALAYRIPRVLHWLAADQWHWIHTIFFRVDTRACGVEWVSTPFIAFFKTDRLLFLISFISFLFLPGLIFSVFTRLGIRHRVAWHWMWIVPTGYCFLLQAGSIGNDLFAAPFVLAAVDFALRARQSQSPRDFFTAVVAAGMMTACKLSNLTLLLPWAITILPSLKLSLRWPLRTATVCTLALCASVLPTAIENYRHVGDWTGMAAEQPGMLKAPVFKTGLNVVLAITQNFDPPIFPWADKWNRLMDEKLPPNLISRIDRTTEGTACRIHLDQMQIEESAGLGFGVSILLLVSIIAAGFGREKGQNGDSFWLACARWSPFISLLALLTQSNLYPIARLLTPYYALLLPPLLAGSSHNCLVKKKWWRAIAFAVFILAAMPLVVSPARPLFPVQIILSKWQHAPTRVQTVYSVYHERNDAFAPAKNILPPHLKTLGLTTFDDPETSLWRSFGARKIIHVCPEDTSGYLKSQGVEYILVKDDVFGKWFLESRDAWLKKMNVQIVQKISLNLRAAQGPMDWQLVKLN